jgi:hypothetical protein
MPGARGAEGPLAEGAADAPLGAPASTAWAGAANGAADTGAGEGSRITSVAKLNGASTIRSPPAAPALHELEILLTHSPFRS